MLPKIKNLTYKVIIDKSFDFSKAPEIIEENDDFSMKMNHEKAVFNLKGHFTSVNDAQAKIYDFLYRWQVIIGLDLGPDRFKFEYKSAEFEQIQEDDKNCKFIGRISVSESVGFSGIVHVYMSKNEFPKLHHRFKVSPDVSTMYLRYKLYRQGKESLTSMAYMCLTILEASARNSKNYNTRNNLRGKASYRYNIEFDILDNLGMFASTKGDPIEARKAPKNGVFDPLKQEERDWIIRAVKILIRRTGEWAYDPKAKLNTITMADI